jgi:hypothetical protein
MDGMKLKQMMFGLLAAGLSAVTANACLVQVRVACPNDTPAVGVRVCIGNSVTGCDVTDGLGIVQLRVPAVGNYTVFPNSFPVLNNPRTVNGAVTYTVSNFPGFQVYPAGANSAITFTGNFAYSESLYHARVNGGQAFSL